MDFPGFNGQQIAGSGGLCEADADIQGNGKDTMGITRKRKRGVCRGE
jgi:hypothetical protein